LKYFDSSTPSFILPDDTGTVEVGKTLTTKVRYLDHQESLTIVKDDTRVLVVGKTPDPNQRTVPIIAISISIDTGMSENLWKPYFVNERSVIECLANDCLVNFRHSSSGKYELVDSEVQWKEAQKKQQAGGVQQAAVVSAAPLVKTASQNVTGRKSGYMNSGLETESEASFSNKRRHRRHRWA
jgi:hypothetical protein